jgi:hypothetical protein
MHTAANEAPSEQHAAVVLRIIREIKRAGARALREIAHALNARGLQTARGSGALWIPFPNGKRYQEQANRPAEVKTHIDQEI